MQLPSFSVLWVFAVGCLASQAGARAAWPAYSPRYPDDDPYFAPKVEYYLERAPAAYPEVYGRLPYPHHYDAPRYGEEDIARQEERLAALPVGQETWYESDTEPSWRAADLDDVKATFLDNLILTQMAQDAQRRRGLARAPEPQYAGREYAAREYAEREYAEPEDEDERELKALAGQPLYHVAKTGPPADTDADDDYPADDTFINWNGFKRSVTTAAPSTPRPRLGQDEVAVPRPAHADHATHADHAGHASHAGHEHGGHQQHKKDSVYDKITQLLAAEAKSEHKESRRIDKRFVSGEADLAAQLRGLKRRMT